MAKAKPVVLSLGKRVKEARSRLGISLEDLAQQSGYTAQVISAIEEETMVPPVALILQLNRILKLDMESDDSAGTTATRLRAKSHKKRVDAYAYQALTRPKADMHLRAYQVTIEPHTEHKGVEYHHEGEEFIYVLEGELAIQIGENMNTIKKGQSIHFDSSLHHKLNNPSSETAVLLVVIYVP
jgi:mannose-6-phosphate isomerase-like protein (cupin superfamily)